ncbi:M28 family metallopeptidase [[Eubacterium] cellulosolvens]
MHGKGVSLALTFMFLSVAFNVVARSAQSVGGLTPQESQLVSSVNGTNAYNYALRLEEIALDHNISAYTFRVGGSAGALEAARWIEAQFASFGLETYEEKFEFKNWTLLSQPELTIGCNSSQFPMRSFHSAHYSWPTPQNGVSADLVVLPLPEAAIRNEVGIRPINMTIWNAVDTSGKILLIGKEVRWSNGWEQTFKSKLTTQPPAAVVYTWWYDWMSNIPPKPSSAGGRPLSVLGAYFWNLKIPVGWVNYEEGVLIRDMEQELDVSANVKIDSAIGFGPHHNVIGKLEGLIEPGKIIIISAHYDTVMTGGFCDNAAGTSGMLELARVFSEVSSSLFFPKYTILFISFASEELGFVGSINYVSQHKDQMKDIVAVVNLDSIGNGELFLSETPGDSLKLDDIVYGAAQDLNASARLITPGGSDQEAFRDPTGSDYIYGSWGLDANISDALPVKSSILISSSIDPWTHTSYDNSTSTETLGWVQPDNLQNHIRVAALSILRIFASTGATTTLTTFTYPTTPTSVKTSTSASPSSTTTVTPPPRSVWTQWWFWTIIIVVIVPVVVGMAWKLRRGLTKTTLIDGIEGKGIAGG